MEDYKKIIERTKRRFWRDGPAETSNRLQTLAKEHQNNYNDELFAAYLWNAAADYEKEIKRKSQAASLYLKAAKIFKSESERQNNICLSQKSSEIIFQDENIQFDEFLLDAIEAFKNAADIYISEKQYLRASNIYFEIGNFLKELNRQDEAAIYYERCSATLDNEINDEKNHGIHNSLQHNYHHLFSQVETLGLAADCYIQKNNMERATTVVEQLVHQLETHRRNSDTPAKQLVQHAKEQNITVLRTDLETRLSEYHITLFLLYLIQKEKSKAHDLLISDRLFDDGSGVLASFNLEFMEDIYPLLKFLLEACVENDVNSIYYLTVNDLPYMLSHQHQHLMFVLHHVYRNPIYLHAFGSNLTSGSNEEKNKQKK